MNPVRLTWVFLRSIITTPSSNASCRMCATRQLISQISICDYGERHVGTWLTNKWSAVVLPIHSWLVITTNKYLPRQTHFYKRAVVMSLLPNPIKNDMSGYVGHRTPGPASIAGARDLCPSWLVAMSSRPACLPSGLRSTFPNRAAGRAAISITNLSTPTISAPSA